MPEIMLNDVRHFYYDQGRGEPLLLTHSVVWDSRMFDDLANALVDDYRVIRLDLRGHGETAAISKEYTLWDIADDIHQFVQALDLVPVHYAGHSMGGMCGMRLALTHPEDIQSLVLMDTSAHPEREDRKPIYMALLEQAWKGNHADIVDQVLPFFFAASTFNENSELIETYRERFLNVNPEGVYWTGQAVFDRGDISDRIDDIDVPALVLVGEHDDATPVDRAEVIAEQIEETRLVVIPDAGHMSATEQPMAVAAAMRRFYTDTFS